MQTTMDERISRKKEIEICLSRGKEIKHRIRLIETERDSLVSTSREVSALENHWSRSVEYHRQKFITDMAFRSTDGRVPHIKYDSPEAQAFINADRWLAAIPELAKRCAACAGGDITPRLTAIAAEIQLLNNELTGLGLV